MPEEIKPEIVTESILLSPEMVEPGMLYTTGAGRIRIVLDKGDINEIARMWAVVKGGRLKGAYNPRMRVIRNTAILTAYLAYGADPREVLEEYKKLKERVLGKKE